MKITAEELALVLTCPSLYYFKKKEKYNFNYLRFRDKAGELTIAMIEYLASERFFSKKVRKNPRLAQGNLSHNIGIWNNLVLKSNMPKDFDMIKTWNTIARFDKKILAYDTGTKVLNTILNKSININCDIDNSDLYLYTKLNLLGQQYSKKNAIQFFINNPILSDLLYQKFLYFYGLVIYWSLVKTPDLVIPDEIIFYILLDKEDYIAEKIVYNFQWIKNYDLDNIIQNGIDIIYYNTHLFNNQIFCLQQCQYNKECNKRYYQPIQEHGLLK